MQLVQKLDLKYFKRLFAKTELFKCNFFWLKRSSFKLPLSIKSIIFRLQYFFKYEFTCETFLSIFLPGFRIITLENTILVFWKTFATCLTNFLAWFSRFCPLTKSFVPARTVRQSGLILLIDLCFPESLHWYFPGNCLSLLYDYWTYLSSVFHSTFHSTVSCNNHPFLLFYCFMFIHIWFVYSIWKSTYWFRLGNLNVEQWINAWRPGALKQTHIVTFFK